MFSGIFISDYFCRKFSYSALLQGGLIYEAKVQALQKEEGVTLYRIHYKVTFSFFWPQFCENSSYNAERNSDIFTGFIVCQVLSIFS